jgi:CRISPR/Cas system CMR-associated protein Cmr3 (group 5 of RAMP superfamily)
LVEEKRKDRYEILANLFSLSIVRFQTGAASKLLPDDVNDVLVGGDLMVNYPMERAFCKGVFKAIEHRMSELS